MRTLTPARRRPGRRTPSSLLALAVLALSLAFTASASASGTTTLTVNQPDPVVGETITYTAQISGECPANSTHPFIWTYDVDTDAVTFTGSDLSDFDGKYDTTNGDIDLTAKDNTVKLTCQQ